MTPRNELSVVDSFSRLKADYHAGTASRFKRTRTGLGGTADAHINDSSYWTMREYGRDMDRNDAVIGQLVDRATNNIIGGGLRLEAQTGDRGLNDELFLLFGDWADDPRQCCSRKLMTFAEQSWLVRRACFIDGDIFALPRDDGRLQLVEGDRCCRPARKKDVILGVRLDDSEAPVEYWFSKIKNRDQHYVSYPVADMTPYRAFDADGNPQVFHVTTRQRISQTRGLTAFRSVFETCSMIEDINLAKLVQQQIVSCFGIFLERESGFTPGNGLGPQLTENDDDSNTRIMEKLRPGLMLKGRKGEKLTAFTPNVPNAEYFDQVKLCLRLIGAQLGMPLTLVLLDTSETTFHGYRGELNEARLGFRIMQKRQADQFEGPVYRWKVRQWLESGKLKGPAVQKALKSDRLWRHRWNGPSWPYIEPKTDAEADILQQENLLNSPRSIADARGRDYDDILRETIEDNTASIRQAAQAAGELSAELDIEVNWRDVLRPFAKDQTPVKAAPNASASAAMEQTAPAGRPNSRPGGATR